jgi:hypothetical protein
MSKTSTFEASLEIKTCSLPGSSQPGPNNATSQGQSSVDGCQIR